jgi:ABC-type sugar transport system substrate-binding protein
MQLATSQHTYPTTGAVGAAQASQLAKCCSDTCPGQCDQVTKRQVMETADDDFLEAGGLVVSAAAWHKKGIRVNTKVTLPPQYPSNPAVPAPTTSISCTLYVRHALPVLSIAWP